MTLTSRRFPWLGWKSVDAGWMMFPMIMYWITGKREWFKATMMPMAITEDNITEDIYETAKLSIDHVFTNLNRGFVVDYFDHKK